MEQMFQDMQSHEKQCIKEKKEEVKISKCMRRPNSPSVTSIMERKDWSACSRLCLCMDVKVR